MMINKLCIIGVGLIGGSLARALKEKNQCQTIVGTSRNEASLKKAQQLGVIDEYTTNLENAVKQADIIVCATPLGAMPAIFSRLKSVITADTIITDVGSAKASVIEALQQSFGQVPANFVPGHPIAGTENSGVESSFAELFENRKVILTPLETTSARAITKVSEMWQATGADVIEMGIAHHDIVLAATSHLPHVLAYTLVDSLAAMSDNQEVFQYAAGGFRDFTRIASSDPIMWRDICLANADAIVKMIDLFKQNLEQLQDAINQHDSERILKLFENAKQVRDKNLLD